MPCSRSPDKASTVGCTIDDAAYWNDIGRRTLHKDDGNGGDSWSGVPGDGIRLADDNIFVEEGASDSEGIGRRITARELLFAG